MRGIYKITCTGNNTDYIGQSKNIEERWKAHKSNLRNNKHKNKHLQNAYNKYGEDSFIYSILEEVKGTNQKELDEREIYYIDLYDSKDNGFNQREGGSNGSLSEETKKKISESRKGKTAGEKHHMYGKHHSEESRKKMAEAQDSTECFSLDLTTLCRMRYGGMNEAERYLRKNGYKKASNATIHKAIYGINGRSSAYNKLWSLKDFNELTMEEIQALVTKHFKRIEASIEALSEKVIAEHPTTGEKLIFNSIMEAERLGVGNGRKVDNGHVVKCCKRNHAELNGLEIKHINKSCAGYRWYYVDDFKKYFRKEWEEFIKNKSIN